MKKQPVSPEATGGAGTVFEYRVAAITYSHLLAGTHPPGLVVPLVGVGLQQRVHGHLLDDIVVTGEAAPVPLCTEFQVKRTLTVTAGDPEFVAVVAQALHVLCERAEEVARGDLALGVAARGRREALKQLEELTDFARGHTVAETFGRVVTPDVVNQKLRTRLEHVRKAVETAIGDGAPDLGGVETACHAFLAALHVWIVSDREDGADYRAALDRLGPLAASFGVNAVDVFEHLATLAQGWGPTAGVVDASSLHRHLRRRGLGLRTSADPEAKSETGEVDADAVVRGPVAALELDGALDQAQRLLDAGDPSAVEAFAKIANRLEDAGYGPHAVMMRRRQADALQNTGRPDEAMRGRIGLAWNHLDAAQPWEARFALHDGRRPGVAAQLSASLLRARTVTDAAVEVVEGDDIDGFVVAFDALEEPDPYRERAAALLCEEAIAASRPEIIRVRRGVMDAIARAAANSSDRSTQQCSARILMCVAEATDQWAPLLPEIHRRYPRQIVAWAHARYGRHLALSGDGPGAQEQYLRAVECACVCKMFDEAADWLYALRTVRIWYTDFDRDEQHPQAQALRINARPSQLPGSPYTAERALRALLDESRPHEALGRIKRWRWQAVTRAHLTEEIDAVGSLGVFLQRDGQALEAVECFVRAGQKEKAVDAARALPEEPARLSTSLLTAVEVSRAAAYAAVAAATDLISDDDAGAWATAALAQVRGGLGKRWPRESAFEQALSALAAMVEFLTDDQARELLQLVEPLIGNHGTIDKAVAKILLSLMAKHPDRALPLIAQALLADQQMADIIHAKAERVLTPHKKTLSILLADAASTSEDACIALILAGADPAPTIGLATQHVKRWLTPRIYQPGSVVDYVGATNIAILAYILDPDTQTQVARTLLERALERREASISRRDSLTGLFNIIGHLDQATRATLLPPVMEIARGTHDGGPVDSLPRIGQLLGSATLTDRALQCAARLGPDDATRAEIERLGLALLRTETKPVQWSIVQALAALPGEPVALDLHHCAAHPAPALRALAALHWAKQPDTLPAEIAVRLAHDDDHNVREVLARALHDNHTNPTDETVTSIVHLLSTDVRRSIRILAKPLAERLPPHHDQ